MHSKLDVEVEVHLLVGFDVRVDGKVEIERNWSCA